MWRNFAFFLAASLVAGEEPYQRLNCGTSPVTGKYECAHTTLLEAGDDVRSPMCRRYLSGESAVEPRALSCNAQRKLRDSTDSVQTRSLKCKRYLSEVDGSVLGLHCEHTLSSAADMAAVECHRFTNEEGTALESVHCKGLDSVRNLPFECLRTRGSEDSFCVINSAHERVCGPHKQETSTSKMCFDLIASEMSEVERTAMPRMLPKDRSDDIRIIRVPAGYGYGTRQGTTSKTYRPHVPQPLTPMPHNPWRIEDLPEQQPIIKMAPLRPIAPTPIMILDHQLPSDVTEPRRRLSLVAPNSRPICTPQGCGPSVLTAPQVVVQRDEITTVVKETSCPEGTSLEGGMCVGLDLCPPAYSCARGFVEDLEQGDCVTESQPVVECYEGYSLVGGVCTRGSITQAAYTCDQPDYHLDSASKVCTKEISVPPVCPSGYKMQDGQCVQSFPSTMTCREGYTLSPLTKDCVATKVEAAAMSCPEGATQTGEDKCVVIRQEPPRCPPRFTLDTATNTCAQAVPRIPGTCPPGFQRNGSSCERISRSPASPTCPSHEYELRGELCHRDIPQESRCPAGSVKVGDETCERVVQSKPVCSEGKLKGDACVVEVDQPAIECCAPGFTLSPTGGCERVETFPPKLSCDGECYRTTSFPVAFACPNDAEFHNHPTAPKCVRKVGEDCAPQQCPSGATDCPKTACRDIINTHIVPAEPYCPNGGMLEDGRCVAREPVVPERSCSVGTLDEATGLCTRTQTAPLKFECPAGSKRVGKRCVTEEMRPAQFVCPEGAEENAAGVCVVRTSAIPVPPKVHQLTVTYTCPDGTLLSGKECLTATTTELPQVCPAGAIEGANGSCTLTAPVIVPPPTERPVRPSYYCSNGTLSGRQCSYTERHPPEYTCCNDATLDRYDSRTCVRTTAPISVPPRVVTTPSRPYCESPTAEQRGCVCLEHEEMAPMISCAAGYELVGDKCKRRAPQHAACPEGTKLEGDACVRRVEVAPIVRIINGCEIQHEQPVCYSGY